MLRVADARENGVACAGRVERINRILRGGIGSCGHIRNGWRGIGRLYEPVNAKPHNAAETYWAIA